MPDNVDDLDADRVLGRTVDDRAIDQLLATVESWTEDDRLAAQVVLARQALAPEVVERLTQALIRSRPQIFGIAKDTSK